MSEQIFPGPSAWLGPPWRLPWVGASVDQCQNELLGCFLFRKNANPTWTYRWDTCENESNLRIFCPLPQIGLNFFIWFSDRDCHSILGANFLHLLVLTITSFWFWVKTKADDNRASVLRLDKITNDNFCTHPKKTTKIFSMHNDTQGRKPFNALQNFLPSV